MFGDMLLLVDVVDAPKMGAGYSFDKLPLNEPFVHLFSSECWLKTS